MSEQKKKIFGIPGNINAPIITDRNGSYTGIPAEPFEIPVQDADDL